jgi:predicted GIY-YIG superfamily endonuclease
MQFWAYMLRCSDGSYYVGHTDNLEVRLAQHQAGEGADWTRRRRPVELAWAEAAPTRDEAFAFERRIKGWTRAKKEALVAGDWGRIHLLAKPLTERPSTSLRTSEGGSSAKKD